MEFEAPGGYWQRASAKYDTGRRKRALVRL